MYQVTLTDEQYERITIMVAGFIDTILQPQLDEAMASKKETRVSALLELKKSDQAILQALYGAKRVSDPKFDPHVLNSGIPAVRDNY